MIADIDESKAPLLDHLIELRRRLLWCVAALLAAFFACLYFAKPIFAVLVQPLVAGIYTADPERLSLAATLPRFLEMEQEYRSLIRAAWEQRKARPRILNTRRRRRSAP